MVRYTIIVVGSDWSGYSTSWMVDLNWFINCFSNSSAELTVNVLFQMFHSSTSDGMQLVDWAFDTTKWHCTSLFCTACHRADSVIAVSCNAWFGLWRPSINATTAVTTKCHSQHHSNWWWCILSRRRNRCRYLTNSTDLVVTIMRLIKVSRLRMNWTIEGTLK